VTSTTSERPFAPEQLPRHVAIIMDGNGRWATRRGLPRTAGHRQGVEALRRTVRAAGEWGIPYVTLYGFSSENWSRPEEEISDLMGLLKRFIHQHLAELHDANVRVRVIGEEARLDREVLRMIEESTGLTEGNTGLNLTIAFNYGARAEIARAAARAAEAVREGRLAPGEITEETFGSFLDTADIPDPDLLVRTSGEKRISNFLLWQCAYSEFVFLDVLWPDFGPESLAAAIDEFLTRDRRYGGLSARPAI
jgi:undecaprenyl diphosphate synthase